MSYDEATEVMRQLAKRLADEPREYCLTLLADRVRGAAQLVRSGEVPAEEEGMRRVLRELAGTALSGSEFSAGGAALAAYSRIYAASALLRVMQLLEASQPPARSASPKTLDAWSGRLRRSLQDELGPLGTRPLGDLVRVFPLLGRAWFIGDVPLVPPDTSQSNPLLVVLLVVLLVTLEVCIALATRPGKTWPLVPWWVNEGERLARSGQLERNGDDSTPVLQLLDAVGAAAAESLRHAMRAGYEPLPILRRLYGDEWEMELRKDLPGAICDVADRLRAKHPHASFTESQVMSQKLLHAVGHSIDRSYGGRGGRTRKRPAGEDLTAQGPRRERAATLPGSADKELEVVEFEDLVARALSPRELEVWTLHEQGWRQREIAERLGLADGTVNALTYRARQKLKSAISAAM